MYQNIKLFILLTYKFNKKENIKDDGIFELIHELKSSLQNLSDFSEN